MTADVSGKAPVKERINTVFDTAFLDALSARATASQRLRQHHNIHASYSDPCQRLLNAMEPGTYIPPHRHASVGRRELLVALRGWLALVTFDDDGSVNGVTSLKPGADADKGGAAAVELAPETWHTVLSLASGSVLLEIKAGPFDPTQACEIARWAPEAGSTDASEYVKRLEELAARWLVSAYGLSQM